MASDGRTSTRRAELLGLFAFALALMLLISLATFNPADPAPFFKAGSSGSARNFIGPFGAFLAELLVAQLFGVAALLIPLVLGLFGWKLFWCKPVEAPYTKAIGLVLLLLSLTAFLTLTFASVAFEGEVVRAGGATGQLLAGLLIADFGRTGAYIMVATSLFVSLILSTQFSFAAFLRGGLGKIALRLRGWRTTWAHWQESRRKDRMRREVIRKHTQNRETAGESLPRVRKVKTRATEEGDEEPLGPSELGEEDEAEGAKAPRKKKGKRRPRTRRRPPSPRGLGPRGCVPEPMRLRGARSAATTPSRPPVFSTRSGPTSISTRRASSSGPRPCRANRPSLGCSGAWWRSTRARWSPPTSSSPTRESSTRGSSAWPTISPSPWRPSRSASTA